MLQLIAGVIFMLAFVPGVIDLYKGAYKPRFASLLVWLALDYQVLISLTMARVVNPQMIAACTGITVVTVMAVAKDRSVHMKVWEKWCLLAAVVGFVLTFYINPVYAAAIGLFVLGLGSIPTIVQAYKQPENESFGIWGLFTLSSLINVIGVSPWNFGNAIQPIQFLFIDLVIFLPLLLRKLKG